MTRERLLTTGPVFGGGRSSALTVNRRPSSWSGNSAGSAGFSAGGLSGGRVSTLSPGWCKREANRNESCRKGHEAGRRDFHCEPPIEIESRLFEFKTREYSAAFRPISALSLIVFAAAQTFIAAPLWSRHSQYTLLLRTSISADTAYGAVRVGGSSSNRLRRLHARLRHGVHLALGLYQRLGNGDTSRWR